MNAYCDTHGLNLPCKKCMEDRAMDQDYLQRISDDFCKESKKGGASHVSKDHIK